MAKTAYKLPYNVIKTASCPFPWDNIWWPGKTDNIVSESGAPRYTEGIKSRNVCVMDIATIKITKINGSIFSNNVVEDETKMAETRLICTPGNKPVMQPQNTPMTNAKINSISNICLFWYYKNSSEC